MDIDDAIKTIKVQKIGMPRPAEEMYCYRCAKTVLVYKPTADDIRRDPTLDDYIGDNYCANCIRELRRTIPRDNNGQIADHRLLVIDAKLSAYTFTPRELDFFDMEIRMYKKQLEEKNAAKRLARASRKRG